MNALNDVYIVAAKRTPVGKGKGELKNVRPDDLLVHALQAALATVPKLPVERVADVIIGCAMPEAEQGMNVARISSLLAGLPESVPAITINRFCASGLQSIAFAAERIQTGQAEIMIAGGTESMSMIPMGGHSFKANPRFTENEHIGIAYGMGITAEKVATQWQISREQQDEFALESHQKALAAIAAGQFTDEIAPIKVTNAIPELKTGQINSVEQIIEVDQGPRESSLESLAKLRAVFAAKGSVTAGNSSPISDGAAALILVNEKILNEYQLDPLARFVNFSVAGVPPEIMGIGPIKAIPMALKHAGIKQQQLDWIELNEAFAAQSLAVINELNLDAEKINPLGGAIALGHPLGATGAIRACTAIHGLRRTKQKYGMVTMCIGTGMGAAGVFEAL